MLPHGRVQASSQVFPPPAIFLGGKGRLKGTAVARNRCFHSIVFDEESGTTHIFFFFDESSSIEKEKKT